MSETEETRDQSYVEKESEDNTQVADAGVPGQILYPEREVDAEHAAAFAAGKEDSLYPDDEEGTRSGWQNPADRPEEEQTLDEADQPQETNEETEPEAKQ